MGGALRSYDPEFVAAKRKKARNLEVDKIPLEPETDLTWQQMLSRHGSTSYCEDLWGMSVFLVQPFEHSLPEV